MRENTDSVVREATPDEPPSEVVVRAIADARDEDPTDIPPLWDEFDPEALDSLFDSRSADTDLHIVVRVQGYEVRIRGDGTVGVRQPRSPVGEDGKQMPN